MDDDVRDRLQTALLEHRSTLRRELVDQGANPDDPHSLHVQLERGFADSALTAAEQGRMLSLLRELRDELAAVERALRKFDRGTYGICERCGNEIAVERLDAIPWTPLCITDKQRLSG
jgi:RNA polymerase-binding transcription factor DksA